MTDVEFPSTTAAPNYRLSLMCVLFIKAALMVYVIQTAGIGLGPDEAQYWTWSQHLDWGYYSKPPGIAWEIFAGTYLLGDTELGVRFGALVVGFLLAWAVYWLAKACGVRSSTAFWAGVVMASAPVGILASFFTTTDGGFILFWTLGLSTVMSAVRRQTVPNYALVGFWVFCGALFKWTTYTLWPVVFFLAYFVPSLRSPKVIIGIVVSLLGLIPSILWNRDHDWATFRHVWSTNIVGKSHSWIPFQGNFLDFMGAQVALLSPIFFGLFICALVTLWRHRPKVPLPVLCCGYVSVAIFVLYAIFSLFSKMQGNWCVYAYPPAIVVLCWYAGDWLLSGKPWLFGGSVLAALLMAFVLYIPRIQANDLLDSTPIPWGINPFRHNVGWDNLEKELRAVAFDPDQDFLFSKRYQTTSILSFYNESQVRAYFFNLGQTRRNQFSYWPGMSDDQKGRTGFFVEFEQGKELDESAGAKARDLKERLKPYFKQIRFLGRRPLFYSNGKVVKAALIFECIGYNGKSPEEPEKF